MNIVRLISDNLKSAIKKTGVASLVVSGGSSPIKIFEELKKIRPDSGGEIQLSDALNEQAIKGKLETVEISGKRFDCGTSDGYLEAILHSAKLIGKL